MAREPVTIDQLAAMVANGLQAIQEEVREGFRSVHEQLGGHGRRLDGIESELKDHGTRLDRIERKRDNTIERGRRSQSSPSAAEEVERVLRAGGL